ncbi:tetratricopeptide repeat protein [Anaerocolumna sp. AGMB13025]|uniref:tetratricopeptide repeat protein n=1 Tax=Anaerocolumna sp. AGMB13025 TaxID=3039116 RepID=UPI00241FB80C|nr:tetratricopeptide repeat protein [Anaerocolumna sp. AGMB13025]WFR58068.1 tetratricopeptide repeat protein [Anaerocolumna sp. AGMB13025]
MNGDNEKRSGQSENGGTDGYKDIWNDTGNKSKSQYEDNRHDGYDNRFRDYDNQYKDYDKEYKDDDNQYRDYDDQYKDYQKDDYKDYENKNYQYDDYRGMTEPEQKKLEVPGWIILFLILVVALDVVCMIRFPKVLSDYKVYAKAENRISSGETTQVINDLKLLSDKYPDSVPVLTKSIKLSMENGYYDVAGYIMDTYLTGKSLSDSEYDRINRYYTQLEAYYKTYDAIDELTKPFSENASVSEADYEKLKTDLESLLNEAGQDYATIYYYLGSIETDLTNSLNYFQSCYDTDPEIYDVRVRLAVLYRRMGDYKTAERYVNEALAKEKTDSDALRSMAILKMLEGDLESGRNLAKEAYDMNPDGNYIKETYLIALSQSGMKAEAEKLQEEIIKKDGALDEDTVMLLNGDITLENYYVE